MAGPQEAGTSLGGIQPIPPHSPDPDPDRSHLEEEAKRDQPSLRQTLPLKRASEERPPEEIGSTPRPVQDKVEKHADR